MDETIETQRKRLRFRSWHRGTRELDLLLGRFADAHLGRMSPDQLDRYEAVLEIADSDIYRWVSGAQPVPTAVECDVTELIRNFTYRALQPEITR